MPISDPDTTNAIDSEDMIENADDEAVMDAPADESEDAVVSSKRRMPLWPFLILLGALLGFAASFAATYFTRPASYDPEPLRAELEQQEAQIASLQKEIETQRDRPAPRPRAVDLSPLEDRLTALENTPLPEWPEPVPPIDEALVTRLEALKEDGFEVSPPPDLAPLLTEIEALSLRVEALEARPTVQSVSRETLQKQPDPISIESLPTFPADILREGAEARRGGLFSKHFRVRTEDDPLTLIEGVEADLSAGNAAAAVEKFDRLPQELQNLARGWRADMALALSEGTASTNRLGEENE